MADADKDEDLTLSASTFAALSDFYAEQDKRDQRRAEILQAASDSSPDDLTIDSFTEDWQLSQFWYDDDTADKLADECVRAAGEGGSIACISCPTLFLAIRKKYPQLGSRLKLFEFDKRFASLGPDLFVFYDYNSPLDIPRDLRESFDVVFADPPFLSEECLTKTAVTIKFLAKKHIVLCSGM